MSLFDVLDGAAAAAPSVRISLPGPPVPKGRPRFRYVQPGKGRAGFVSVYTPAETVAAEKEVAQMGRIAMRSKPPYEGALAVRFFAMVPVPASWSHKARDAALSGSVHPASRPDWDNYGKLCSDALNAIVWKDDSQIVRALVVKEYAERPGYIIEVFVL